MGEFGTDPLVAGLVGCGIGGTSAPLRRMIPSCIHYSRFKIISVYSEAGILQQVRSSIAWRCKSLTRGQLSHFDPVPMLVVSGAPDTERR